MPYILDRPLCLTADKTQVVEETDPRAAFVLGGKGSQIPTEEAIRLGLLKTKSEPETKVVEGPPAAKVVTTKKTKK
jgi:hypothetical protein